jgi:dTDP-4-amino-4,6-dideoxygalactose transaminase
LPAGEQVNKFEAEFGKRFQFRYNLMVNSGSSANLVMIAALKIFWVARWR